MSEYGKVMYNGIYNFSKCTYASFTAFLKKIKFQCSFDFVSFKTDTLQSRLIFIVVFALVRNSSEFVWIILRKYYIVIQRVQFLRVAVTYQDSRVSIFHSLRET